MLNIGKSNKILSKALIIGRAVRLSQLLVLLNCLFLSITLSPASTVTLQQTTSLPVQNQEKLISDLLKLKSIEREKINALLDANQSQVSNNLWEKLISHAKWAYYMSPEKSVEIYKVAVSVAERLEYKGHLAVTYFYIGSTYASVDKTSEAMSSYLISKRIFDDAGLHRDVVYILSNIGALYLYLQDYRNAKIYSEQSLKLANDIKDSDALTGIWPDDLGVAGALSTLGVLFQREGDYTFALEYLHKSLSMYQSLNQRNLVYGFDIIDNLTDLARAYYGAGDSIQSLIYLNRALRMAEKLPYKDRTSRVLHEFGVFYLKQEDYEKATYYLRQSLSIDQMLKSRNELAIDWLNLGVVEQRRYNYDDAFEKFKISLQFATEVSNRDVIIAAKEGIGAIHRVKGNHKLALETLDSGLTLARELEDKTRIAEILWRKAEVFYDLGSFSEAAALAEESFKLAQQLRFFNLSYYAATVLGKAQLAQKKTDLAIQTLSQAIEQVEEMRGRVVGQEQGQQLFFENKLTPHHILINLFVKEGKVFDALAYAERAKGRVLLDVLSKGRVQVTKAMTKEEAEEERRLNQQIIGFNSQIRDEISKQSADEAKISQLKGQLDSARFKYASFENILHASHPELKTQRGQTPLLTPERLGYLDQSSETVFIEYVVTKEQTYLFILAKGAALKSHVISISEESLIKTVKKFHQSIAARSLIFTASSRELYDLLLKPIEPYLQGKTTICVIPDGILWDVPFQALLSNSGRYLIEDYAIYSAPSLSTLIEMKQRGKPQTISADQTLLAFGNPVVGAETVKQLQEQQRGEGFDALPDAEIEVKTMAQLFGQARSKVFTGADANEKVFKTLGPNYSVIHFATHGILDNRNPLYSYLLLSKSEGDDDGLLEAREIMNLDLPAEMAVLSACETARGRIGAGEGVIGMSWALFVAGCRTTVVSQWKVDSAGTANLMTNFYGILLESKSKTVTTKPEALRQAALKVMKDRRYRHPYYWAGFVVVGSDR